MSAPAIDLRLEVVQVPVSDVDRAKAFYADRAGFVVDHDSSFGDMRVVQLTPPGSACSIVIGTGLAKMDPGHLQGLQLVVTDIEAARARARRARRRRQRRSAHGARGRRWREVRVLQRPRRQRVGRPGDPASLIPWRKRRRPQAPGRGVHRDRPRRPGDHHRRRRAVGVGPRSRGQDERGGRARAPAAARSCARVHLRRRCCARVVAARPPWTTSLCSAGWRS